MQKSSKDIINIVMPSVRSK